MKCRKCGTEIAANALICYRCGTAVEELPGVGSQTKKDVPGWIGLALSLVALLAIGFVTTRVVPGMPATIVWIVVGMLAFVLVVWRMARRRR